MRLATLLPEQAPPMGLPSRTHKAICATLSPFSSHTPILLSMQLCILVALGISVWLLSSILTWLGVSAPHAALLWLIVPGWLMFRLIGRGFARASDALGPPRYHHWLHIELLLRLRPEWIPVVAKWANSNAGTLQDRHAKWLYDHAKLDEAESRELFDAMRREPLKFPFYVDSCKWFSAGNLLAGQMQFHIEHALLQTETLHAKKFQEETPRRL